MIALGSFEVTSGAIVAADPGRSLDRLTGRTGVLDNALNGEWVVEMERVEIEDWGEVCSKLVASHHLFRERQEWSHWTRCDFIVGVDSGQAGLFDLRFFGGAEAAESSAGGTAERAWFERCCDKTSGELEAGVLRGGAVARSGTGNGSYKVFVSADGEGRIVGVKLVFIEQKVSFL